MIIRHQATLKGGQALSGPLPLVTSEALQHKDREIMFGANMSKLSFFGSPLKPQMN